MYEKNDEFRAMIVRDGGGQNKNILSKQKVINEYSKSKGVSIINIVPENFKSNVFDSTSWEKVSLKLNLN